MIVCVYINSLHHLFYQILLSSEFILLASLHQLIYSFPPPHSSNSFLNSISQPATHLYIHMFTHLTINYSIHLSINFLHSSSHQFISLISNPSINHLSIRLANHFLHLFSHPSRQSFTPFIQSSIQSIILSTHLVNNSFLPSSHPSSHSFFPFIQSIIHRFQQTYSNSSNDSINFLKFIQWIYIYISINFVQFQKSF